MKRRIDITNHFAFADFLMEDWDLTRRLLSVFTGKPVGKIVSMERERTAGKGDLRNARFDLQITDDTGHLYIVEKQDYPEKNLDERISFYPSVMITESMKKGSSYEDRKEVTVIFLYGAKDP